MRCILIILVAFSFCSCVSLDRHDPANLYGHWENEVETEVGPAMYHVYFKNDGEFWFVFHIGVDGSGASKPGAEVFFGDFIATESSIRGNLWYLTFVEGSFPHQKSGEFSFDYSLDGDRLVLVHGDGVKHSYRRSKNLSIVKWIVRTSESIDFQYPDQGGTVDEHPFRAVPDE